MSKRAIDPPKVALLDSGLAAGLTNLAPEGAGVDASPDAAGRLIETFVIGDLRRQLGWSEETPRLHHYRDRAGAEVDLLLETPDGRVAAIEVKAGATVRKADIRWLTDLRDKLAKRFVGGLVLHTGPQAQSLGDRLAAVPVDALWTTGT